MAETHTVMPKKLAQALIEHSVQHFDAGGSIAPLGGTGGSLLGMNQYSASGPTQTSQSNLAGEAGQQYQQQQDVYGQQQTLANQLLAQTQGQGPGQQLIAQQQGQNAAQQGALMASARGAQANPALIARQAAMAGAQGNQQALNAQSALQLQSQGALAQQQAQMGNQAIQGQSVQQGAIAAQNNANLSAQNINANISQQNANQMGSIFGGLAGAAGSALGAGSAAVGALTGLAHGGAVPRKMDLGGPVDPMGAQPSLGMTAGGGDPMGSVGTNTNDIIGLPSYANLQPMQAPAPRAAPSGGSGGGDSGGGGGLGSILSSLFAQGGQVSYGQMLAGGNVPGKAKVSGDSEKNDVVPTMLSPGEVVLPRSVTQSPDAEKKAAEFMAHLKKKKAGYSKVAEARKAKRA